MEGLGQEGQDGGQKLGDRDAEEEADGDDAGDDQLTIEDGAEEGDESLFHLWCDIENRSVEFQKDPSEVEDGDDQGRDDSGQEFLPDRLEPVLGVELPGGNRPCDHGGGLVAGIAAGIAQGRDEGDQDREGQKGVLEAGDDHAREGVDDKEDDKPDGIGPGQAEGTGLEIRSLSGSDGGLLEDILGVLLLDDVQDVVEGDDAQKVVVPGDDRKDGKVELPADPCRFLSVGDGADGREVLAHHVPDLLIFLAEHQLFQALDAQEMVSFVGDEDRPDGLLVLSDRADQIQDFFHGLLGRDGQVFGGHDGADRVVPEAGQGGENLLSPCRDQGQDLFSPVLVEVGQEIDEVVVGDVGEKERKPLAVELLGDGDLVAEEQIGEDLAQLVIVLDDGEEQDGLVLREGIELLGQGDNRKVLCELADLFVLVGDQEGMKLVDVVFLDWFLLENLFHLLAS